MTTLAKSFEPAAIEATWTALWEQAGTYAPTLDPARPSFSIQLPPPNVTGTLHMGHAFNQTIMDALVRYHRMKGENVLWVPGTDHAGIATQIVVERQLEQQGSSRHALGREAFVEKVWAWKQQSGSTITGQMRRLGASVDWSHEYFTMDPALSKVVTDTFVQLHDEGLIYRGKRLVSWDPVLRSAVSDLEVESAEEDGFLWLIRYELEDGSGSLDVATTRPETMLGDTALMVHPDDERYADFVGKKVRLPLVGRLIPVIADPYVDRTFGTGVVKVTPAHDANDYAVAQRRRLPYFSVLRLDGTIGTHDTSVGETLETATSVGVDVVTGFEDDAYSQSLMDAHAKDQLIPKSYVGLDRFVARKRIVQDLTAAGHLVETRRHKLMVPRCARTGQVVEPMLTEQWFMAVTKPGADGTSIAQKAVDAVASGAVRFVPENWIATYDQWMSNLQDWCLSRQLWWGHRIPAWHGTGGEIFVARDEAAARARADAAGYTGELTRDPDVLDTWYSSAMVPFSTLGWPDKTKALELFLPSSVLVTGYEIIFFWVARMIMMTTHFAGRVPFETVYIHGMVRDGEGRKMSKSEGNVIDPVDLIQGVDLETLVSKSTVGLRRPETAPKVAARVRKEFPAGMPAYGADALRFTMASYASLGRSINFDTKRCEGYRNFCNKLWNATKFVLMNCEDADCGLVEHTKAECAPGGKAHGYLRFGPADRWIVNELQRVEAAVGEGFAALRLDNVANAIYAFVWDEYCDWYIEIAKAQLAAAKEAGDEPSARATRRTLLRVLEAILRLLHPLTPFISAELWSAVAPVAGLAPATGSTIATAAYPQARLDRIDATADAWVAGLKAAVGAARGLRSEIGLAPSARVPLLAIGDDAFLQQVEPLLKALAKVSQVERFADEAAFAAATRLAAVAAAGTVRLALRVEVDVAAEGLRLDREIERMQAELGRTSAKLANTGFVARAPEAVVAQERRRLDDFKTAVDRLRAQRERLAASI